MSFLEAFGMTTYPFRDWVLPTSRSLRLFVDREQELQWAIQAVNLRKNLLVVGQMGIGKTSLINVLRQRLLNEQKNLMFIDVRLEPSFFSPNDGTSLLKSLAFELLMSRAPATKRQLTPETMSSARARSVEEYLRQLRDTSVSQLITLIRASIERLQRTGKKLVFVFDDVDKADFDLTKLSGVRDSLWEMNAVYILTSSMVQYRHVLDSAMRPFFSMLVLRGLTESQTMELIDRRIKYASDKSIEDVMDTRLIPLIYRLSQGNPRQILFICDLAFRAALNRHSKRVILSDLNEYVTQEVRGPLEKKLILTLLPNSEGLTVNELHQVLTKSGFAITRARVSQILGGLLERRLVYMEKAGRFHRYRTPIPQEVKLP